MTDIMQLKTKPNKKIICPSCGKKLRLKDLTKINFTKISVGSKEKYIDPLTKKEMNNSSSLIVLKATGDVILEESYNVCIKPFGKYNGTSIYKLMIIIYY